MKQWGHHGDVILVKIDEVPRDAKRVESVRNKGYILAEGEHTGHAHVLVAEPEVELFERNGTLYIKNPALASIPATITHEEHTPVKVPEGVFEIRPTKEYDHFLEETHQVAD